MIKFHDREAEKMERYGLSDESAKQMLIAGYMRNNIKNIRKILRDMTMYLNHAESLSDIFDVTYDIKSYMSEIRIILNKAEAVFNSMEIEKNEE